MRNYLIPTLMVCCTLLVAVWMVMARISQSSPESFNITPGLFAGFQPRMEGWKVEKLPVAGQGDLDANIVAYSLVPNAQGELLSVIGYQSSVNSTTNNKKQITNNRLLVRLVHGYNMPMCMKIKHFTVEKIQDYKVRTVTDPKLKSAFREAGGEEGRAKGGEMGREVLTTKYTKGTKGDGGGDGFEQKAAKNAKGIELGSAEPTPPEERLRRPGGGEENSALRSSRTSVQNSIALDKSPSHVSPLTIPPPLTSHPSPFTIPADYPLPIQLWRVTSSVGTVSIWATTMIRGGDFSPTEADICSMAFPRVDTPDDPNWVPRGLGRADLKHPVAALRQWFRSRWDASQWDILAFLKLRRSPGPSEELLSYITVAEEVAPGNNDAAVQDMLAAHAAMLKEMQEWRGGGRASPETLDHRL